MPGFLPIADALAEAGMREECLNINWAGGDAPIPRELELVRVIAGRDNGFAVTVYADTLLSDGEYRQPVNARETVELLTGLGVRRFSPGIVPAPSVDAQKRQTEELAELFALFAEVGAAATITAGCGTASPQTRWRARWQGPSLRPRHPPRLGQSDAPSTPLLPRSRATPAGSPPSRPSGSAARPWRPSVPDYAQCCPDPGFVTAMHERAPRTLAEAQASAAAIIAGFDDAQLLAAVNRHDPIGVAPENELSRREQVGVLTGDPDVLAEIAELDRAYRARFGTVFLIRASDPRSRYVLSRATTRRIMLTFRDLGFLESPDGKTFGLTPRVLQLGYSYLSTLPLREVARPHLEELSADLHETTGLAILDGEEMAPSSATDLPLVHQPTSCCFRERP